MKASELANVFWSRLKVKHQFAVEQGRLKLIMPGVKVTYASDNEPQDYISYAIS